MTMNKSDTFADFRVVSSSKQMKKIDLSSN